MTTVPSATAGELAKFVTDLETTEALVVYGGGDLNGAIVDYLMELRQLRARAEDLLHALARRRGGPAS